MLNAYFYLGLKKSAIVLADADPTTRNVLPVKLRITSIPFARACARALHFLP